MDIGRFPLLLSVTAVVSSAVFAHAAQADTWNLALVRCNETAGELEVKEDSTEGDVEEYKTPEAYQSKWLGELVEYISPPNGAQDDATHGTFRHKTGEWRLSCNLRGVVYNIVISPWSVNDMVMGECGGGDPDLELSVHRDNRVLLRKLRLGGTCSTGSNDALGIGAVNLSEPKKVATLDGRKIPYSDMPLLNEEKLRNMDNRPVANLSAVAATPRMASNGYRCNETGSQQEMNACAELNFNAADKEINEVYKDLKMSLAPAEQAVLVQDERKWLKRLDATCRKSANREAEGGSMWPMVFWQCKADTTKLRIEALRHWQP